MIRAIIMKANALGSNVIVKNKIKTLKGTYLDSFYYFIKLKHEIKGNVFFYFITKGSTRSLYI